MASPDKIVSRPGEARDVNKPKHAIMKNELPSLLLDYQAAIVYAWVMIAVGILGVAISPYVYKEKADRALVIFISVICIITGVYLLNTL